MTEEKAITGCKKGDRISQKFLFDAYSDGMLALCIRYIGHLPDAEEQMLNGFYKFYRSIDQFVYRDKGSIKAWLKKIMVNECLMFLRKKGTLKIAEKDVAENIVTNDDPLSDIQANEIFKIITTLPPGYRTVFNLYVVEGYTHKEIAELLKITESTSKSQLNRARTMMQQLVKQKGYYYEQ